MAVAGRVCRHLSGGMGKCDRVNRVLRDSREAIMQQR